MSLILDALNKAEREKARRVQPATERRPVSSETGGKKGAWIGLGVGGVLFLVGGGWWLWPASPSQPGEVPSAAVSVAHPPVVVQTPPPTPVVVQTPPPAPVVVQAPPPPPVVQTPPPAPVVQAPPQPVAVAAAVVPPVSHAAPPAPPSADKLMVKVVGVASGCAFEVRGEGEVFPVVLDGVSCPPGEGEMGRQAKRTAAQEVFTRQVRLEVLSRRADQTAVADLYTPDGRLLNAEMVRRGLIHAVGERFRVQSEQARAAGLGVWSP